MAIPHTLLSFLFHSIIPRYRDEMHLDLELAYKRFELDTSIAQLGPNLPTPADVRAAVDAVDIAAFKVRSDTSGNRAPAKQELEKTSKKLFDQLAPLLAAELAQNVRQPNQPAADDTQTHFLTKLYLLVYSPEYRNGNPTAGAAFKGTPDATNAVGRSWDVVLAMLQGRGPRDFVALKAHTTVLSDRLAAEFSGGLWPLIW